MSVPEGAVTTQDEELVKRWYWVVNQEVPT